MNKLYYQKYIEINQNGGKKIKLANIKYHKYFLMFMKYITSNAKDLQDLTMIIGASNMNYEERRGSGYSEFRNDLDRFKDDYDIAINSESIEYIDINQRDLIALTLQENDIYTELQKILPRKFSKIVFDWSVTKFVEFDLFYKLKDLIQIGGELYLDTSRSCYRNLDFHMYIN